MLPKARDFERSELSFEGTQISKPNEQNTNAIKLKILCKHIVFLGLTSANKVLFSWNNIGFIGLISAGNLCGRLKQKTKITLKKSKSQERGKWHQNKSYLFWNTCTGENRENVSRPTMLREVTTGMI